MNHRNYPLFTKVLEQLNVPLANSSMTFSFFDKQNGYGYSGNSLGELFPSLNYYFRPGHLKLVRDLWRFARIGYRDLNSGYLKGKTLGDYFDQRKFSSEFLEHYFYPMGAAIWSSPVEQMRAFQHNPTFTSWKIMGCLDSLTGRSGSMSRRKPDLCRSDVGTVQKFP